MAKPREPWNIRPAKKRASVTASLKTEVETKAKELIETVLKPKYVLPPPKEKQGNYVIDVALYAMRYTGKEWVGVFDALSVDECMKAIQDDEWFAL